MLNAMTFYHLFFFSSLTNWSSDQRWAMGFGTTALAMKCSASFSIAKRPTETENCVNFFRSPFAIHINREFMCEQSISKMFKLTHFILFFFFIVILFAILVIIIVLYCRFISIQTFFVSLECSQCSFYSIAWEIKSNLLTIFGP